MFAPDRKLSNDNRYICNNSNNSTHTSINSHNKHKNNSSSCSNSKNTDIIHSNKRIVRTVVNGNNMYRDSNWEFKKYHSSDKLGHAGIERHGRCSSIWRTLPPAEIGAWIMFSGSTPKPYTQHAPL